MSHQHISKLCSAEPVLIFKFMLIFLGQTYNETVAEFEINVKKFLLENNCSFKKLPCWENKTIDLYDLFMTVYNHGGYKQVNINYFIRDWVISEIRPLVIFSGTPTWERTSLLWQ